MTIKANGHAKHKSFFRKLKKGNIRKSGKLSGALKVKGMWVIPESVKRPKDGRARSVDSDQHVRRLLPVGIFSYIETVDQYYYVDKTLMIRDVIDDQAKVTLFTRARRFGKTLNMDMLRTYFEISKTIHPSISKTRKSGNAAVNIAIIKLRIRSFI